MKMFFRFIFVLLVTVSVNAVTSQTDSNSSMALDLPTTVKLVLERSLDFENSNLDLKLSHISHRISRIPYRPSLTVSTDSTWNQPADHEPDDNDTLEHQVNLSLNQTVAPTGGTVSVYSYLHKYDTDTGQNDLLDTGENGGQYSNTMGVTLDQPLLKGVGWWSDSISLKQADLNVDNAETDFILARRSLILDVIARYYSALKQQKLVGVYEKSVEDAERHLLNTRIKLEEGMVAQMDVSQAELQLARQQTSLIRARQSSESAFDSLRLKLNLPLNQAVELIETVTNLAEPLVAGELVDEALSQRLEIRSLVNQVESARLSVSRAANQRLPALDLVMKAELSNRDDTLSGAYDFDTDRDYSVSMGFSWSLGDRTDRQEWLQARIRLKKLQNNLVTRQQAIEKEVWDEIRNYNALIEALKVSEQSVTIAETALELASVSYQEGLTSNLDLLKAQDDLNNARNGYFSDLMDLALSKARLINAIGREINPARLVINNETQ